MCSTSESSERFLLKQVKDKENTFVVRKVIKAKTEEALESVMVMEAKMPHKRICAASNFKFFQFFVIELNSIGLFKFRKQKRIFFLVFTCFIKQEREGLM